MEMFGKNALPLVKQALEEKLIEVVFPGEKANQKLYLIKMSGEDIDFGQDFRSMFALSHIGADFYEAYNLLSKQEKVVLQNHGVFIDPETMRIVFSFNMAFADYHQQTGRLVRFPIADIFPVSIPDYYGHPCRDGDPCFGPRAKKLVDRLGRVPRATVVSCLVNFELALLKHTVYVYLPGSETLQKLCLIKGMWTKTKTAEDYKIAFPDATENAISIAELSDGKEKFRDYGIFINPDTLEWVFAFNMDFAEYDFKSQTIKYKSASEILLTKGEKQNASSKEINTNGESDYRRHFRGVIMYALTGPRKK
jgi:hypothetical protein